MKIFLGTWDQCTCLSGLARGLRDLGHSVTTMVTMRDPFTPPNLPYDIIRGYELLARYDYNKAPRLIRAAAQRADEALCTALNAASTPEYLRHDLFVLIWRPWMKESILFPLLKRLGKKLIVYYLGSDVRHVSAFSQEFGVDTSNWPPFFHRDPLEPKLQRIRLAELHADAIFSVQDQAGLQVRPYFHASLPLDLPVNPTPRFGDRAVPKVLHAPSRADLKGTSFVMKAVEQLKGEGLQFEFQLLSGVPQAQLMAALGDTDILVDQLMLNGPGMLSAEAMAFGCAVATRALETRRDVFDPKVCNVGPATVTEGLRRLIADRPYRIALARDGHDWARRQHDPRRVAEKVLHSLEAKPEYLPTFYLERYQLPAGVTLSRATRDLTTHVLRRHNPDAASLLFEASRRGLASA